MRRSPDPSPCACLPPLPTASLRRQGRARSASSPTAPAPPPSAQRYAYAGLLRNELTGLSFRCAEHELVGPPRPPRAGRLALRAARVRWPARVCPISTGEAALERMGVSDLTPAAACGALVLMGLAYRAAGYWALRRRFRSPLA